MPPIAYDPFVLDDNFECSEKLAHSSNCSSERDFTSTVNSLLPNDYQCFIDNYLNSKTQRIGWVLVDSQRNVNRQVRSEPANPQTVVSQWGQSTINPDIYRRTFEIRKC
jgi:hypothetical protein